MVSTTIENCIPMKIDFIEQNVYLYQGLEIVSLSLSLPHPPFLASFCPSFLPSSQGSLLVWRDMGNRRKDFVAVAPQDSELFDYGYLWLWPVHRKMDFLSGKAELGYSASKAPCALRAVWKQEECCQEIQFEFLFFLLCLTLRQWISLDWRLDNLITWWYFYFTFFHCSVLVMVTITWDMGGGWKTRKWNLMSNFTKSLQSMGCKVKETCFNRENRVCRVTCWIYVQETKQVSRGHKPIINNHPMTMTAFQQ